MTDAPRHPEITAVRPTGDGVELDLTVPADLLWLRGHFPGFPILPGVVQLDWAMELGARHLALTQSVARQFQVKYKATIHPGDRLTLLLSRPPGKARLSFEYRRDGQQCSSGHIVLDAP